MGSMNFPEWVLKENHSVQCAFGILMNGFTERNIMVLTMGVLKKNINGFCSTFTLMGLYNGSYPNSIMIPINGNSENFPELVTSVCVYIYYVVLITSLGYIFCQQGRYRLIIL